MPSSSRRRRRGGRHRAEPPTHSSASSEPSDWAALPQDILLTVFLKLRSREIMQGAEFVCTTWRRVAVDDPLLWHRIDMGMGMVSKFSPVRLRRAVDRSAGQCEAFWGSCNDDMLLYLVERSPCLKSLHLSDSSGIQVLDAVLKNLPLLEDLQVSSSMLTGDTENLLQSVCQACSLLRELRFVFSADEYYDDYGIMEEIEGIFTTMSELRSLELLDCDLTAEGLTAILDHCPVLESLYITGSFDGEMDAELRAKCANVKNLTLPYGSNDDEIWRTGYGYSDDFGYISWEKPYHPQDHYLCDDYEFTCD